MTRVRRVGALAVVSTIAVGYTLLGPVGAAQAQTAITAPLGGDTITTSTATATASFDGTFACIGSARLVLTGPSVNQTLATIPPCQGSRSATMHFQRNGDYALTLQGDPSHTNITFTVSMAPAAPSGLSASSSGGNVVVQWSRGSEPDLDGYTVQVGSASQTGGVGTYCSGSQCSATLKPSGSGSMAVHVTARRNGGTTASSATSVTVGGGSSGGGGGAGGGGANSPNLPGGGANVPLTPGVGNSQYSLPNVAPQGASQNFAYPTPQPQVAPNQLYRKQGMTTAESQALQWGKSVAIALILLVCAAHLGTWTRRLRTAQAGGGSRASRLGRARVSVAKARIAQAEAMAKAGILDKDAIVREDAAEAKTKKGLLRRRRKGIDQAGVASPLHAEGEAAFLGDEAAFVGDGAAEPEYDEYDGYDDAESYDEGDGFFEDGSSLYADEGDGEGDGDERYGDEGYDDSEAEADYAADSSYHELDTYGSHWQTGSSLSGLEPQEPVDFDIIPSPRPSESPQDSADDPTDERRTRFGPGARGRRRRER